MHYRPTPNTFDCHYRRHMLAGASAQALCHPSVYPPDAWLLNTTLTCQPLAHVLAGCQNVDPFKATPSSFAQSLLRAQLLTSRNSSPLLFDGGPMSRLPLCFTVTCMPMQDVNCQP